MNVNELQELLTRLPETMRVVVFDDTQLQWFRPIDRVEIEWHNGRDFDESEVTDTVHQMVVIR